MQIKVNTSLFCSLGRHEDWHKWLAEHAKDLRSILSISLTQNSCSGLSKTMTSIFEELKKRDLTNHLIAFLSRRFPHVLFKDNKRKSRVEVRNFKKIKNKVFTNYNPKVLSFPSKLILRDQDPSSLKRKVENFTRDKHGVDYVIIDDCAHIEYFNPEHKHLVSQIELREREVYKYKADNGLLKGERGVLR